MPWKRWRSRVVRAEPAAMPQRCERRPDGSIVLSGDLTFATVAGLWRDAEPLVRQPGAARLDLGGVARTDSAGLACVLALLAAGAGRLRVVNVPASMQALARVSDAGAWLEAPAH